jgi:hypothetical protein
MTLSPRKKAEDKRNSTTELKRRLKFNPKKAKQAKR